MQGQLGPAAWTSAGRAESLEWLNLLVSGRTLSPIRCAVARFSPRRPVAVTVGATSVHVAFDVDGAFGARQLVGVDCATLEKTREGDREPCKLDEIAPVERERYRFDESLGAVQSPVPRARARRASISVRRLGPFAIVGQVLFAFQIRAAA